MENKPITIIMDEVKTQLYSILQDSNVNPFLLEPIVKDLYLDIKAAADKQLEYDKQEYQKSLEEEKAE